MAYIDCTAQLNLPDLAQLFGVLSHPVRLQIVRILVDACAKNDNRGRCVAELNEDIGIAQPTLSKHLRLLETCGILSHRRKANRIYYRFARDSAICGIFAFFGNCCETYSKIDTRRNV